MSAVDDRVRARMILRLAVIAGVALYVVGSLRGWLAPAPPFSELGTTARPDEIFDPSILVWVVAILPLVCALPTRVPVLQRIATLLALLMAALLVGVTWFDDPVGRDGEDQPTWGLALSSLGLVTALAASATETTNPRPSGYEVTTGGSSWVLGSHAGGRARGRAAARRPELSGGPGSRRPRPRQTVIGPAARRAPSLSTVLFRAGDHGLP
jgi:hypothetical protein